MPAGLNLCKKSILRMRNPSKLLEKSKSLELIPRKFEVATQQTAFFKKS
jgi:hypothetical protein